MTLKNCQTCAELRSDNPIEAQTLFKLSRRSYSPRASGLMPNEDQMMVILPQEIAEMIKGIESDVEGDTKTKWAMRKLLSEWRLGSITDSAATIT